MSHSQIIKATCFSKTTARIHWPTFFVSLSFLLHQCILNPLFCITWLRLKMMNVYIIQFLLIRIKTMVQFWKPREHSHLTELIQKTIVDSWCSVEFSGIDMNYHVYTTRSNRGHAVCRPKQYKATSKPRDPSQTKRTSLPFSWPTIASFTDRSFYTHLYSRKLVTKKNRFCVFTYCHVHTLYYIIIFIDIYIYYK